MEINFPSGVEEIVRAVREEVKRGMVGGLSGNAEEDAAEVVIERISARALPDNLGLDPNNTPSIHSSNTVKAFHWAAKQYFTLLLIDLRRTERGTEEQFRDHEKCMIRRNR